MPPEQQDNVWISREEYERLRQAQQVTTPQPVVYGQTSYPADEPAKVKPIQIIIGAILAIGLFLSLTVPFFNLISVPILLVMLIFAAMSFNDFRRAKGQVNSKIQSGVDNVAPVNQKAGSGKYHALLVVLLAILLAPVILIGGLIILLIALASGSGGQSS